MDSRDRIARPGTKAPASPSQNRGQPIQLRYEYFIRAHVYARAGMLTHAFDLAALAAEPFFIVLQEIRSPNRSVGQPGD
jgi:hypothetical protein